MKKWFSIVLTLVLVGGLIGCSSADTAGSDESPDSNQGEKEETTLEKAQRLGYVTIGFANEKPYAYKTTDGELTGEAVEVARAILKNLGINEIKGELTEFGSLISGLNAKRFDMITAGMFVNPKRAKQVAFADPEYSIGESLAVKKGNPYDLHSYQDVLENEEVKIAVMTGAIEIDYLKAVGVPEERIAIVPDQPAAIAALKADRVQAITMTGPSLTAMLESAKDDSIERVEDFTQPVIDGKSVRGYGATAFRKEDTDFLKAFNAELKKLKESGELLEIIKPFGFTKHELPGDVTAEQLSKE
jgi:polar amino acid transport system substrate-binding protein